jgi:hypothetical protein
MYDDFYKCVYIPRSDDERYETKIIIILKYKHFRLLNTKRSHDLEEISEEYHDKSSASIMIILILLSYVHIHCYRRYALRKFLFVIALLGKLSCVHRMSKRKLSPQKKKKKWPRFH